MAKGENIFKRKDGRWEARYIKGRTAERKIIYGFVYGKTYKEAKEKQAKARNTLKISTKINEYADGKRFDYYTDLWLNNKRSEVKESTYVKYLGEIQNHIKPYFENIRLHSMDFEKADGFKNHLLYGKGLSANTVHSILILLNNIMKFASKFSEDTFSICEIKYPKADRKEIRVLNSVEENKLIKYLLKNTDRYKLGVLLMLSTGMRIGEICALRWGNINLSDRSIKIDCTLQRIKNTDYDKKANDIGHTKTKLSITKPKSGTSIRIIPVNNSVVCLLSKFECKNNDSFLLSGNEKPIEPRVLQYQIRKYAKELGLEEVHAHTLRHSFATRAIEAGFDIKSLSEILGHSTTTITLDRYVHSSMSFKRANMAKLDFIADAFRQSDEQSEVIGTK